MTVKVKQAATRYAEIWSQANLGHNDKSNRSASDKIMKCWLFMTDVYNIHWALTAAGNTASDSLFLRGVSVKPPIMKRRSAGAELSNDVLYSRNVE